MNTNNLIVGTIVLLVIAVALLSNILIKEWGNKNELIKSILNKDGKRQYLIVMVDQGEWKNKIMTFEGITLDEEVYTDIDISLVDISSTNGSSLFNLLTREKETKFERFKNGVRATYYFYIKEDKNKESHVMTLYIFDTRSGELDKKDGMFHFFVEHHENTHFIHQTTQGGGREIQ